MNESMVNGKNEFNGWARLCLTMVNDAIDCGDVEFFTSEWGKLVMDGCNLYYDVELDYDDILARTKANHRYIEGNSIFDI